LAKKYVNYSRSDEGSKAILARKQKISESLSQIASLMKIDVNFDLVMIVMIKQENLINL